MSEAVNQKGFTDAEWAEARAALLAKRQKELARHLTNDWTFYGRDGVLKVKALQNGRFSYSAKGEACGHALGEIIGAFVKGENIGPSWEDETDDAATNLDEWEIRSEATKLFGKRTPPGALDKTVKLV